MVIEVILVALMLSFTTLACSELPLTLECSVDKNEFIIGEPVIITLSLINPTTKNITYYPTLDPRMGNISLWIGPKETDPKHYKQYTAPGWGVLDIIIDPQILKPNEQKKVKIFILLNTPKPADKNHLQSELAFPGNGKYGIFAKFSHKPSEILISKTIYINIKNPNDVETKVWEKISNSSVLYFLHEPSVNTNLSVVQMLKDVATSNPNSIYTPHIKRAISTYENLLERRKK